MIFFKTPRFLRWIFPRRTWGFLRSNNEVFLTFDDGPNPEITPWILDFLKEKNLKATFFCVGNNILKYPSLFQRILDEGHVVGNHTMNHDKETKTPFPIYLNSINETKKLVNNNLFRPPYGRLKIWNSYLISKEYQIIMWSWLSYDFDKNVPISTILSKAETQIKAGDILVLHDNDKVKDRVIELLPELVKILMKKGLKFKTI